MIKFYFCIICVLALSSCSTPHYVMSDMVGEYGGVEITNDHRKSPYYVTLTLDSNGQSTLISTFDIYSHSICEGKWELMNDNQIILHCLSSPKPLSDEWILWGHDYIYGSPKIIIKNINKLKYGNTILKRKTIRK